MTQTSFYEVPIVRIELVRDAGLLTDITARSPADIANLLMDRFGYSDREQMIVVHLSTRNDILSIEAAAIGSLNETNIRIAEIFKGAILANAAAIVLCHNHPSGDPAPSLEDILVTKKIGEAGELLGVELIDHLIVGGGRFTSLKERGHMK